jgi:hypothetical protein
MQRSANDWRFTTEAEGSVLLAGFGGQVKLFYFQSERQQVGAWVLYAALGLGLGMKVKATSEGVNALLEIADWVGKPKLKTGSVDLALARGKVSHTSLDIIRTDEWFSLAELDEARGSVFSAGAGFGIGVGLLTATAFKGEKTLFVSEKIGGEFGTLGISIGDSHDGEWWVIHALDLT